MSDSAQIELAGGVPFVSDADLEAALGRGRAAGAADAVVEENEAARIDGLRLSLAVLALLAALALFLTRLLPTQPVGGTRPES